jgi:tRNA 5-methylaminomethyl-2-thiouridine biosynthesis bifunctional protein
MTGLELSKEWAGLPAWRILDTHFGHGFHFLSTWQAWQVDPLRPRLLHYVALTNTAPSLVELKASVSEFPEFQGLVHELAEQWFGLLPGFHRLTLAEGSVLLTVCVGETITLLREQAFVADSISLNTGIYDAHQTPPWDIWTVKALARCCRRGTQLRLAPGGDYLQADLIQCGFEMAVTQPNLPSDVETLDAPKTGKFNPHWLIKNTRNTTVTWAANVGTCAVIGAGLAGSSVASVLAKRGWQVHVLDQEMMPAMGASGLPVGLVVPHVSADDCTLSRLSRSGVRMMLQQARSLLQKGQDWDATGTMERRVDGSPGLPLDWPANGQEYSQITHTDEYPQSSKHPNWAEGFDTAQAAVWHKQAAWLKPAQLVRAWLSQPGIHFQGGVKVAGLLKVDDGWALLDEKGVEITRANRVVFANAAGAVPLLDSIETLPSTSIDSGLALARHRLPAMHGVRGLLSWGIHIEPSDLDVQSQNFPPYPVNGSGSVVPRLPMNCETSDGKKQGLAWFIGASYQPDSQQELPDQSNHLANLARLQTLLPALGKVLAPQFESGHLNHWKNTRCVTSDRLPAVGPLYEADQPSLWICAGMGSRGMSFSMLCAQLLAARWGGEPLPVGATLAQSLNALRGRNTSVTATADN